MATTLRFRPVVLGPLAHPTMVFRLVEDRHGETWLRQFEGSRPVNKSLDAVTVDDLPTDFQNGGCIVTILPVQQVSAPTGNEAFARMLAVLRDIRTKGLPQAQSA